MYGQVIQYFLLVANTLYLISLMISYLIFLPYHVSDDNFNKFIDGNALVKNFKAMVDNRIFNPSEAKVLVKTFNQIHSIF